MHNDLSDSLSLLRTRYNRRIRDFLFRIHIQLNISMETLSEILNISQTDLQLVLKGTRELNVLQFSNLADYFKFSMESFNRDEVDFSILASHYLGDKNSIPQRYTIGARSQIRAIKNMAQFIQQNYGQRIFDTFLRHFQITEAAWLNPDRPINVFLVEDALALLTSWGFTPSQIEEIGKASVNVARGTPFALRLESHRDPKMLFEHYFSEDVRLVESNNDYTIAKLTDDICVMHSQNNPEVLEFLDGRPIGGVNRCLYRTGALKAATHFINLPESLVEETRCLHRGDSVCEFQIDFRWASYVNKKWRLENAI